MSTECADQHHEQPDEPCYVIQPELREIAVLIHEMTPDPWLVWCQPEPGHYFSFPSQRYPFTRCPEFPALCGPMVWDGALTLVSHVVTDGALTMAAAS